MLGDLVEVSLRVAAVGLLGWAAAGLLRKRGAEARHAVWVVVLVGMLLMPVLMALAPEWRALPDVTARGVATESAAPFEMPEASDSGPAAAASRPVRPGFAWPEWPAVVMGLYFAVAAVLLARTAWVVRRAQKLVEDSDAVVDAAVREATGVDKVEVRESATVLVPMAVGWRERVILLPRDWREWEEFDLRAVLAHEAAHVRRGDWTTSLAAALNKAVFWFHPQAWWVERRLMRLAEEACDAAAIEATGDARRYGAVVLRFAAVMGGRGQRLDWAATAMARSSRVGKRIERILEGEMSWSKKMTRGAWTSLLLAAAPLLYGAAALQMETVEMLAMPALRVAVAGVPEMALAPQTASALQAAPAPLPPPPVVAGAPAAGSREIPGLSLTEAQARDLETLVAMNAEDLEARTRLLWYYFSKANGEQWAKHLTWMVARHPEAPVFDQEPAKVSGVRRLLADEALIERLTGLWRKATAEHPSDGVVLRHAAVFFSGMDAQAALDLLQRARLAAPQDQMVLNMLMMEYMNAVSLASGPGAATGEALEFARQALRDLERSGDPVILGQVGRTLSSRRSGGLANETAGMAQSPEVFREMGIRMLQRARMLEPGNPSWGAYLELAELGPTIVLSARPAVPRESRVMGGGVTMRITVGADGAILDAKPLDGPEALFAAAVEAAKSERLKPSGKVYDAAAVVVFQPPQLQLQEGNVPKRITVGGNVQESLLVTRVDPEYPPLARQARIQGLVRFTLIIGEGGGVLAATLVAGHPLLVQAAVDAVKQWRYRPTLLNGQPVEVVTQADVRFNLPQ
ncbi:MAG: M56 family metallopeptidase [Candidatus Solibacter usitatus]|nr:M56 family metallopeptidase [Candidatus Solibacter usitatus]